ncbi:MAG: SDR family oxidoreductase [Phycisphaerales bacterium]|nr:MAG: SDR family oxidoreductase [Phycisphaerales bacterium]
MSFLQLEGKTVLVFGVANRRSVAWHVSRVLEENGATVIHSVRSPQRKEAAAELLAGRDVYVCDVEHDDQIAALAAAVGESHRRIDGILHSIAFANYESFSGTFHEVSAADFLQAVHVSCYSLIAISNAFKDLLSPDASVVTISISTTQMAAEGYGYMAPAKAALDSAIAFLAKSFSGFSRVRFNAVRAGLLKTSASAGIPGYVDNYLYAEQVTLRKQAVATEEVAHVAAFLLSPRSSGINAQGIVVDAGMAVNYFDAVVVKHAVSGVFPAGG